MDELVFGGKKKNYAVKNFFLRWKKNFAVSATLLASVEPTHKLAGQVMRVRVWLPTIDFIHQGI